MELKKILQNKILTRNITYIAIKKQIIAACIIAAVVILAGCMSENSGNPEKVELKSVKEISPEVSETATNATGTGEENITPEKAGLTPFEKDTPDENDTSVEKDSPVKEDTSVEKDTPVENDTPVAEKESFITNESPAKDQPGLNEKPYGEDAVYISTDPVIIYGSLPEQQEIGYIKEDKVIFKFLYSSKCMVCKSAIPSVPEIKKKFGERVIVEEMDVYGKENEKWKSGAKECINAERFPFTLAIGMNSLEGGEINLELVSYTDGFDPGTYEMWKQNICSQFRDKPASC
jgi:thiol-disulfide isomerase/thioredoxin